MYAIHPEDMPGWEPPDREPLIPQDECRTCDGEGTLWAPPGHPWRQPCPYCEPPERFEPIHSPKTHPPRRRRPHHSR